MIPAIVVLQALAVNVDLLDRVHARGPRHLLVHGAHCLPFVSQHLFGAHIPSVILRSLHQILPWFRCNPPALRISRHLRIPLYIPLLDKCFQIFFHDAYLCCFASSSLL